MGAAHAAAMPVADSHGRGPSAASSLNSPGENGSAHRRCEAEPQGEVAASSRLASKARRRRSRSASRSKGGRQGRQMRAISSAREETCAKQSRQLYQKLDKTQEWAENNYYQLPIEAAECRTRHGQRVLAGLRATRSRSSRSCR